MFAHATLHEEVYMEIPKDFSVEQDSDYDLQLNKSLYGLCQAPLSWYEYLKANLDQHGFTTSKIDPCLFINPCQAPLSWYEHLKTNLDQYGFPTSKIDPCLLINHQKPIFCLVHVDDVIWVAPSHTHIHTLLNSLEDDFDLTLEGDIQTFLGIQFTHLQNGTIQLTQCGLIDQVLQATGMLDSNPDQSTTST